MYALLKRIRRLILRAFRLARFSLVLTALLVVLDALLLGDVKRVDRRNP